MKSSIKHYSYNKRRTFTNILDKVSMFFNHPSYLFYLIFCLYYSPSLTPNTTFNASHYFRQERTSH